MRILKGILLAVAAIGLLGACEKESTPPSPIEGIWEWESYSADVSAVDPQVGQKAELMISANARLLETTLFPAAFRRNGTIVSDALFTGTAEVEGSLQIADRLSYLIAGDSIFVRTHYGNTVVTDAAYAFTVEGDRMTWEKVFDPADVERSLDRFRRWMASGTDFTIHSARETITLRRK